MEQTCDLLQSLGLQSVTAFRENGIMGGDLLELSQEELQSDLGLTPLQVTYSHWLKSADALWLCRIKSVCIKIANAGLLL